MSFISLAELRQDEAGLRAITRLLLAESGRDAQHRLIWTLFGDEPCARRDFLFREIGEGRYLIVSQRRPHAASEVWRVETKPYAPVFLEGTRCHFQLRANPVTAVRRSFGRRGRRRDVMGLAGVSQPAARNAAALAWLVARAETIGAGLQAEECEIAEVRTLLVGPGVGRLRAVDFRGLLTVTDPARLHAAAIAGIGRAKAYGCGLLLLRPLAPDVGPAR